MNSSRLVSTAGPLLPRTHQVFLENVVRAASNPRGTIVNHVFEFLETADYDLIHFLQVDEILKEIHRHGRACETPVVGTIIGSYFRRQDETRTELASKLISYGLADVARMVPDVLSRCGPWNHLNLNRTVRDDVVADFFVASKLGRDAIRRVTTDGVELPTIPDPIDRWWDDPLDKTNARDQIDLPNDEFIVGMTTESVGVASASGRTRRSSAACARSAPAVVSRVRSSDIVGAGAVQWPRRHRTGHHYGDTTRLNLKNLMALSFGWVR